MPTQRSGKGKKSASSLAPLFAHLVSTLSSLTDDRTGRLVSELFLDLPSREDYPDYYETIQNPIALNDINANAESGKYSTLQEIKDDVMVMIDNARTYNRKGSVVYKDAMDIKECLDKTLRELTDKYKVSVTDTEMPQSPFSQIIQSLYQLKVKGRMISEFFEELPDASAYPDYYKVIKQPISLAEMKEKAENNSYATLTQLEADMALMVKNAKTYNEADSIVVKDAEALYAHFKKSSEQFSDILGTSSSRQELDEMLYKGKIYHIGDFVYIENSEDASAPHIVQIHKLYSNPDALYGCWYFRPSQTRHPVTRRFYKNEVFKSDRFMDHRMSEVTGRCLVMFVKDFVRGVPKKNYPGVDHTYVCESRYSEAMGRMDKIKDWRKCLPDVVRDVVPELTLHDTTLTLEKVNSPFFDPSTAQDNLETEDEDRRASGRFSTRSTRLASHQARAAMAAQAVEEETKVDLPEADVIDNTLVGQVDTRDNKVLWFPGPPLSIRRFPTLKHSLSYLQYAAAKRQKVEDVEMGDAEPVRAPSPKRNGNKKEEKAGVSLVSGSDLERARAKALVKWANTLTNETGMLKSVLGQ